MRKLGLTHIYYGDGKGKTTAAIGLAVRARGAGIGVLFAQFLKGRPTAELAPLEALGAKICRTPSVQKFIPMMDEAELEACKKDHIDCFEAVKSGILSGDQGLCVLDEAIDAVTMGMLTMDMLQSLISLAKGHGVELVITGHSLPKELVPYGDYITQMKACRHPYEQGVAACEGIEY